MTPTRKLRNMHDAERQRLVYKAVRHVVAWQAFKLNWHFFKSSRTSQSRGWRLYDAKPLLLPPSTTQISAPLGNLSTAFCISCFPPNGSERRSTRTGRNATVRFRQSRRKIAPGPNALETPTLSKATKSVAKHVADRQKNTSAAAVCSAITCTQRCPCIRTTTTSKTLRAAWYERAQRPHSVSRGSKQVNVPPGVLVGKHHRRRRRRQFRHYVKTRQRGGNIDSSFRLKQPSCSVDGIFTFSGVKGSREPLMTSDGNSWFASFPVGFPPPPMYTTPSTHSGLASVN